MVDPVGVLVRILAPDASPDAYNDWQLVFTSGLADWARVTVVAIVVVALLVSAHSLARLGRRRRNLLMALRLLEAMVIIGLVMMPAIELRAVSKVRSRVALLVDSSRSMALATPDGTRAEMVAKHIERSGGVLNQLSKDAVLELATFDDRVHPVESLPAPPKSDGARTDIARSLSEISFQSSGRDLGAVIIYSDGTDTEGLTLERASSLAKRANVPIYAIGFSKDSSAVDLAVRRVLADDFAFVHNTVSIDVELEQRGLDLKQTMVTLKKGGEVVASKEAKFGADGRARVTFDFKPNRIGKQAYQVSVPIQEGEVVKSNNVRSLVLKVIRDRIRVLQVAGRPSWDERFLRELLERNPNVDLISFFILRTPTDLQKAPQDELALIPFPVQDLFTSELKSFDIVIYQNFTYRPYRMAPYLANIADYVRNGGSFLMIGGDQSFEDGWYANTPISSILPVRLGGGARWQNEEYKPRLTPEGRRHPITLIGEPGEPPESVYARLPKLSGVNSTLGLMPGAQALWTHPSLPGNPPIVALREVERGRTMAVMTDSMWFWRFVSVGEGGAGREFDRFWSNTLRWLIRDPELARVRLESDHSVYALSDPVGAQVRVLGHDYRGMPNAQVRAELFDTSNLPVAGKAVTAKTGADGTAVVTLGEVPPGTYVLRAEAFTGTERIGRAEEPIIVEAADVELQAPFPRPEVLEVLATASGGAYVDINSALPDIEIRDPRRIEVDRTRQVAIWDTWGAFGLLLLLASLEWWIRRRSGLL